MITVYFNCYIYKIKTILVQLNCCKRYTHIDFQYDSVFRAISRELPFTNVLCVTLSVFTLAHAIPFIVKTSKFFIYIYIDFYICVILCTSTRALTAGMCLAEASRNIFFLVFFDHRFLNIHCLINISCSFLVSIK